MADNYLEKAREDYEERKQRWFKHQSHLPKKKNDKVD